MEIVSKLLRTLTKVFSDANLFSNLVTIDVLKLMRLLRHGALTSTGNVLIF